MDGLKQVMAVKSKSVLPFLIPKLTTPPVNTKALAILSSVAGEALIKHLEKILPAMIQAVNTEGDASEVVRSTLCPNSADYSLSCFSWTLGFFDWVLLKVVTILF